MKKTLNNHIKLSKNIIIIIVLISLLLACQDNTPQTIANPNKNNNSNINKKILKKQSILYYFQQDDLVGVKDEQGNIIIKPSYSNILYYNYHFPITTPYLELFRATVDSNYPKNALAYPAGDVYDRQGNLLYQVLTFDNGIDDWQEGLRRYVDKNGKVGFVNKKGDVVIPAQYLYVSAFNYGYAMVYTGNWQKDCNSDCIGFKPADNTAKNYFINKQGERVDGYKTKNHPKDRYYLDTYYPYPFKYNDFEKFLLDNIQHLSDGYYLEITEKPSDIFPYYKIELFDKQSFNRSDTSYLIDESGQVLKADLLSNLTPIMTIDFNQN